MASLRRDGCIWILTIVSYFCFVSGQTKCSTKKGNSGVCMPILDCNVVLDSAFKATADEPMTLNYGLCGVDYTKQIVYVCCPSPSHECKTPEGEQGICKELETCPHLMKSLEKTPTISEIKHIYNHICHDAETESVCCASKPSVDPDGDTNTQKEGETCVLGRELPDPRSQCCGFDASFQPKIVGGKQTEIDEFPWLVLLEYQSQNTTVTDCGGSLITGMHVLTAAHCIAPNLIAVRLGEYNMTNRGPDCIVVGNGMDCNDEATSVAVDEVKIHPLYRKIKLAPHDIAVIKLRSVVQYTDFVRPLCLPTEEMSLRAGELLDVAGWGVTESGVRSDVKRKVSMPFVSFELCKQIWASQTTIIEFQVCAGGEKGVDSCAGDSGGPLMKLINNQYVLVGILNFGLQKCGSPIVPNVCSKVSSYIPWIKETITTI